MSDASTAPFVMWTWDEIDPPWLLVRTVLLDLGATAEIRGQSSLVGGFNSSDQYHIVSWDDYFSPF